MNAYDCSRFHVNPKASTYYAFGTDPANLSRELRKMADKIDDGSILIRRIITVQRAMADDFANTRVLLDIVEAKKKPMTSDELAELAQETKP